MDPFEELGVSRGTDLATVREAYTRLTRALHAEAPTSEVVARIARINVAFQMLTDPRPSDRAPLRLAPDVTDGDGRSPRPWANRSLAEASTQRGPALWTARQRTPEPTRGGD